MNRSLLHLRGIADYFPPPPCAAVMMAANDELVGLDLPFLRGSAFGLAPRRPRARSTVGLAFATTVGWSTAFMTTPRLSGRFDAQPAVSSRFSDADVFGVGVAQ